MAENERIDASADLEGRLQYFYDLPHDQQGFEWIKGEIVVKSPVRLEHNRCSINLFELANVWVQLHGLGFVGIEKILIDLGADYKFEPDVCFFDAGKARLFNEKQSIFPVPDWVAEVLSEKTRINDLKVKFEAYEGAGVGEYWIVDPGKELIEQYVLKDGRYELRHSADGMLVSVVIRDFVIPEGIIFDSDWSLELMTEWLAESEKQRAEMERQRAESERQRAEMEKQRADNAIESLHAALKRLMAQGMSEAAARELLGM
jgi:Uma2 family endonuclease